MAPEQLRQEYEDLGWQLISDIETARPNDPLLREIFMAELYQMIVFDEPCEPFWQSETTEFGVTESFLFRFEALAKDVSTSTEPEVQNLGRDVIRLAEGLRTGAFWADMEPVESISEFSKPLKDGTEDPESLYWLHAELKANEDRLLGAGYAVDQVFQSIIVHLIRDQVDKVRRVQVALESEEFYRDRSEVGVPNQQTGSTELRETLEALNEYDPIQVLSDRGTAKRLIQDFLDGKILP